MCFVDFMKVFDSISHDKLWVTMMDMGYPLHLIDLLAKHRLRWYGHVLRIEDDDWVKKCMEYEVEGPRPTGRPKRTRREVARDDCQARKLKRMPWIVVMEEVDKGCLMIRMGVSG